MGTKKPTLALVNQLLRSSITRPLCEYERKVDWRPSRIFSVGDLLDNNGELDEVEIIDKTNLVLLDHLFKQTQIPATFR